MEGIQSVAIRSCNALSAMVKSGQLRHALVLWGKLPLEPIWHVLSLRCPGR